MSASHPHPNMAFDDIVAPLEALPEFADAVPILQGFSTEIRDHLMMLMEATRQQCGLLGQTSSVVMLRSDVGISYVCFRERPSDLAADLKVHAIMDKHKHRAANWLGLATFLGSPQIVNNACFNSTLWRPNARLDALALNWFRREKPSRNQPCWCESGQKFKRCHGRPR